MSEQDLGDLIAFMALMTQVVFFFLRSFGSVSSHTNITVQVVASAVYATVSFFQRDWLVMFIAAAVVVYAVWDESRRRKNEEVNDG